MKAYGHPSADLMFRSAAGSLTWNGWVFIIIGVYLVVVGITLATGKRIGRRSTRPINRPGLNRAVGAVGAVGGLAFITVVVAARPGHLY